MRIYLLRHGETAWNREGRYLGRSDLPLSPRGRAALVPAGFAPEEVFVSPLVRTAETAALLFPGAPLTAVADLREMDFGLFEGRTWREMEDLPAYRQWVDGGCLGRIPGGACKSAFCRRTCAAFAALTDQSLAEGRSQLVIVAHGGTQMAVLERYALPRRDYFQWRAPTGGGFVLDAGRWRGERTLELLGEVRYTRQ